MKKLILPLVGLILTQSVSAQLFSESFDTSIPATWTIIDEDGLTSTSSQSTYASWAWNSGVQDASSSSWYNNSGLGPTSDWLITPAIVLPAAGNYFLQFHGASHEASFLEEYEVRVSVAGTTIPEFTTQILNVVNEPLAGVNHSIDLSAFLGQTIHIAFHHTSNDESMLHIDNVVVKALLPDNATLVSSNVNRFSMISTNNTLTGVVTNSGSNTITSVTMSWNDGTDHSAVINTNIASGATATVSHSTPVNYGAVQTSPLTVTITNVNGNVDPDPADNIASTLISTIANSATRNVVIEEGTGTWCGWCPRGAVAMEYMYNNHPNQFIGIAVHNGDPMTVTEYDNGADLSGFPGCNVDRILFDESVSSTDFENFWTTRKDVISAASVSATITGTAPNIAVNVVGTFNLADNNAANNYRLAVVMVEDGVTGTGSTYNQTNYYSSTSQNLALDGAGHNWQTEPNPVPAASMVYDHVGRALLGGYDGQVGSVPAILTEGQTASYSFNYTIPASSNAQKMHAVALIIDTYTGQIINAAKAESSLGVTELEVKELNIFPNPATDNINVSFDAEGGDYVVTLTDLSGRIVSTNNLTNVSGTSTVAVNVSDLKAGNYLVAVANGSSSFTKMVTIK